MIRLKDYKEYWEEIKARVPELTGAMGVTVDEDMAKKIKALPLGSITLFWLPPHAAGSGHNVDAFKEKNLCVVFVMEKYDPARRETMVVLENTQLAIERVKELILDSQTSGCSPLTLDSFDLNTLPETKFFAGFAGWSVAFHARSLVQTEKSRTPYIFSRVFSKHFN